MNAQFLQSLSTAIFSAADEVLIIFCVFIFIHKLHARPKGKAASAVLKREKKQSATKSTAKLQAKTSASCTADSDSDSDDSESAMNSGASTVDSESEFVDSKSAKGCKTKIDGSFPQHSGGQIPPWKKGDTTNRIHQKEGPVKDSWTSPVASAANANAKGVLCHYWNLWGEPPSALAKQLHQMLTSSKIAVSPETYHLLVDIAVHAGDLETATQMSRELETKTAVKLSQVLLDSMLDLHLCPAQKCAMATGGAVPFVTVNSVQCTARAAETDMLQSEVLANLTKHSWVGIANGAKQKHRVFVDQNKVFCLSMGGDECPRFQLCNLHWNGITFTWGKTDPVKLTSTCAEISDGTVVFSKGNGELWQWCASQ
eukprot:gnl/MRDRNA2_/MRDRNA2_83857_c1_seq13.p1 gnl/MRDRNA2_/MRDRNA2_83857_c1~~gnl/MRDRNA2_/MRDRNA2_83857_c1_seq13.p1  ORF type:complete len:370 (+),score=74.13 gnl/MRDRNA2_/MRDRNA2_83857_c1_seq13:93-1202(+)